MKGEIILTKGKNGTGYCVKYYCDYCGKVCKMTKSIFDKWDHHFCDGKCYGNYKKLISTVNQNTIK